MAVVSDSSVGRTWSEAHTKTKTTATTAAAEKISYSAVQYNSSISLYYIHEIGMLSAFSRQEGPLLPDALPHKLMIQAKRS